LEQAGGITFSDGSIAGFGNSDSQVDAPLYNFVREVDYCSVTVLATRRLLFEELNGFDEAFRSLDYAAADYGLKVRRSGHQVFYQPESASTYVNRYFRGADSFDRAYEDQRSRSHKIFMSRWKDWLKQRPALPPEFNLSAWQELAAQLYQKEGNG
jgi:GT2 family glycosyltransferase